MLRLLSTRPLWLPSSGKPAAAIHPSREDAKLSVFRSLTMAYIASAVVDTLLSSAMVFALRKAHVLSVRDGLGVRLKKYVFCNQLVATAVYVRRRLAILTV